MSKQEFSLTTPDGVNLVCYKHLPQNETKAVMIIVHGMAEHAQRYDSFAEYLSSQNYATYAYDQRGHGKTAGSIENLGFFAEENGWQKVTDDLQLIVSKAKEENPGKKIFILGHSMGSFITRTYIAQYSQNIDGAILSGTAGSAGLIGKVGKMLTCVISTFKGKRSLSPLLDKMSFGDFNKSFAPNRTKFDWLSSDNSEVDKYVNDPYCGTIFSIGFFNNLMNGLEYVSKLSNAQKVRKDLNMYLFSGGKDPVSKNAKQIPEVFEMYKNAGIENISMKIYDDARHETLNETIKNEVYADILNWLNKYCD